MSEFPGSQVPAFGGADLTNCDREPIHIPASVQPHGALLALEPRQLHIVHAGGDTLRILGTAPADMTGKGADAWFTPPQIARLRALLEGGEPMTRPLHAFSLVIAPEGQPTDVIVHRSGDLILLELEPLREASPEDTLALVQTMLLRTQQADSSHAFCQAMADVVRAVSGFDRVMVYRFLPDGSGVVDAEARSPGVESFLGLHYPASDIPRQARQLYLRNWLRLIPDAQYVPAPIVPPVHPRDGRPLDLSHSVLRSVSPIHLQYLANMGVQASMSLSIVMHGYLWGLIACHHHAPRFLPHRLRIACELFAQMASAQLEMKVAAEEFEARLHTKRVHEELVTRMSQEADLAQGLTRYRPNLLDYIPADGVGLWVEGHYTSLGHAPTGDQVAALVAWLNETATEGVFHTDRLPHLYPPAAAFAGVASGLIALAVSRAPRDYVLWFRPEVIRTVTWAGNPNKPVETEPDGIRLTPRKSFAAWCESVRMQSQPWRSVDVEAAQTLRLSLLEVILRRIDQVAREREKARLKQQMLLAELNRRLDQWQAVACELKEETRRRALVESELSQVLRRTVDDQEAERRRIARELHDSLGQTLTLLRLGLEEIGHAAPASGDLQERLAALKDLTTDIGRQANRLAWEIRPTALDDLGLPTAIRHLVETWAERTQLQFDLHLTLEDRRLDPAVETTLYRVLQEAITNVARHAAASRVGVILEAKEQEVRMIVEDDGRGFVWEEGRPADLPARRLGLLGIRERLSLVGGTLEVESAPGQGATLFVRVPLAGGRS
ncbi:GAF domain-containing protein [Rhodovastum atsumiense]|uniref:GAF domain-containing protein n=1 Tax=Rhodovastum atsumiense TaxID=504468 RepID=A0A5M6IME2_9PROT|nr:GAF domain-containing protein [Rhodovastum atsumiense]KAA5609444.1 GAF domain-containing protein [Rhodovastum atsumiense]CAH2603524.1 GAF domain-containing protein [Rhodovastum atsumiense]